MRGATVLARCPIWRTLFLRSSFPRKQKPLLGTLTRSPWLFLGHVFPENKAPARNADLVTLAFLRSCFPKKQKPLLGTLTRSPWLLSGHVFPRKQKALAGNADPVTPACFHPSMIIYYPSMVFHHPSPIIHHPLSIVHHPLWRHFGVIVK